MYYIIYYIYCIILYLYFLSLREISICVWIHFVSCNLLPRIYLGILIIFMLDFHFSPIYLCYSLSFLYLSSSVFLMINFFLLCFLGVNLPPFSLQLLFPYCFPPLSPPPPSPLLFLYLHLFLCLLIFFLLRFYLILNAVAFNIFVF